MEQTMGLRKAMIVYSPSINRFILTSKRPLENGNERDE